MKTKGKYNDLLLEMLAIPSLSRNESRRADFLESWLSTTGYLVIRSGNNLLVSVAEEDPKPAFLFCSHIDTVPPAAGWDSDPFTPLCKGDRITALGANDAGASVIAMIAAFESLVKEKGNMQPKLLLCAEEEVSGKGGVEQVLPLLFWKIFRQDWWESPRGCRQPLHSAD